LLQSLSPQVRFCSCNTLALRQLWRRRRQGGGSSPGLSVRVVAKYTPVELADLRDDHTRVWEVARELETTHPDGTTTVETVKSYIHEKGSGLCYRDEGGEFVPSVPEWRETPEGFVIDRCAYGLAIAKTIGSGLRYTVEGNDLLLRPAYLMISDGVRKADLAILNPETRGFILPGSPSVLRFPAAFGPGYDLQYVAEKGGFHQNLIVAELPPLPGTLDAGRTEVFLYTEMNLDEYLAASGLAALIGGEQIDTSGADLLALCPQHGFVSFCRPKGDGPQIVHAFGLSWVMDSESTSLSPFQPLAEKWLMRERSARACYLVESLAFSYLAHPGRSYPVTWDFVEKKEAIKNPETWVAGTTYWVSSNLDVSAKLTVETGAFVKLDKNTIIFIVPPGGEVEVEVPETQQEGSKYERFTNSGDDDPDWGEEVPKTNAGRYTCALQLCQDSSASSVIRYCMFRKGGMAAWVMENQANSIRHNIISEMPQGIGICFDNCGGAAGCDNNLITGCEVAGILLTTAGTLGTITSNTIDRRDWPTTGYGVYAFNSSCSYVKDNLLSNNATGIGVSGGSVVLSNNGFWKCPTTVSGVDPGPNNVYLTDDENPYAVAGGFFVEQSCRLIDGGYEWASDPLDGPHPYSTCTFAKRDVGRIDIGFQFTSYANTDGDSLPDAWEMQYYGDLDEGDNSAQTDNDGLTALEEFWHGSSPVLVDTDGDGYSDSAEVGIQEKKLLRGWGPAVYDFMAGPWLTNVTSSAVTVGWWVDQSATTAYVWYKKETDASFTRAGALQERDHNIAGKVYEKRLTGLLSGTVYQYYVQCTIGGAARKSPVCRFRTLEADPSSFSFVAYGDSRSCPSGDPRYMPGHNNNGFNEYTAHVGRGILGEKPSCASRREHGPRRQGHLVEGPGGSLPPPRRRLPRKPRRRCDNGRALETAFLPSEHAACRRISPFRSPGKPRARIRRSRPEVLSRLFRLPGRSKPG